MFSRALRTSRAAAPLQNVRNVRSVRSSVVSSSAGWVSAMRTVTTDAASAHADKEAVPEVSGVYFFFSNDGEGGMGN
jgi:pyruvate dehydrogenase E1 component alpha subunit